MSCRRALRLVLALFLVAGSSTVAMGSRNVVNAGVDDGWTVISVGKSHSCGVTTVGEVFCWGNGNEGQLGDGTTNALLRQMIPLEVTTPAVTWTSVDVGSRHSCGLTDDGHIWCWGIGSNGEIGNGDTPPVDFYPSPQQVVRPAGVVWASVSAGNLRTCALTTTGDLYCWGANNKGQLGVGDLIDRSSPTLVPRQNGSPWTSVDAGVAESNNFGGQFTCGVNAAGDGFCWGDDRDGDLGDDAPNADAVSPSPVATPLGVTWQTIRAGVHHGCGVDTTGSLWCWGNNRAGQLGLGAGGGDLIDVPTAVSSPSGVVFADVDPGFFTTCAIDTDGEAWCWGSEDLDGGLGDGNDTPDSYDEPTQVVTPFGTTAGDVDHRSIDVGPDHVCTVDQNATGWCWGRDANGQLGDDEPTVDKFVPFPVGERTSGPQDLQFLNLRDEYLLSESPVFTVTRTTSGLDAVLETTGPCTASGRLITLNAAGTCQVTATQPGDADWDPAPPVSQSFEIVDGDPPPAFGASFAPNPVGLGESSVLTFELDHTGGVNPVTGVAFAVTTFGDITANSLGTNTCDGDATLLADSFTYANGTLAVGETCEISINVTAPSTVPSLPTSRPVSGGRLQSSSGESNLIGASNLLIEGTGGLAQTITFDPLSDHPLGDGDRVLSASASSGLTVSFVGTGVCSATGTTLTFTAIGTCTVTASQAGNATFDPAPDVVRSFEVVASDQTIDFAALSDWSIASGDRTISATASSGLDVSFAATGACSIVADTLSFDMAGTCTVTASQPGDATFGAAPDVERSFEVLNATLAAITVEGPAAPTTVGAPATFRVVIPTAAGLPAPTGLVRFTAASGQTADVAIAGGEAAWTVTDLPPGTTAVSATYLGDGVFDPRDADGTTHEVVTAAPGITGLPSNVTVGEEVTVTASGFFAGEDVVFVLNSDPVTVGTVTSNATGSATLTFDVPDVDAGPHTLRATGGTSGSVASADTTVAAASTTPTTPTTPTTVPPGPGSGPDGGTPSDPGPIPVGGAPAPTPDPNGVLPATGSGVAPLTWATLMLLVGLVVTVGARRGRSRA